MAKSKTILLSYKIPPFQSLNSIGTSVTLTLETERKSFWGKIKKTVFDKDFTVPHEHVLRHYTEHWDHLIELKGLINPDEL